MGFSPGQELTGAGGIMKAGADVAAGDERDELEKANAQIADAQAKSEIAAGNYNSGLARQKGAQVEGAQVAAIGGNNLQQGGTPAAIVANTAKANEINALQINNNALRRAWGFETQGASDKLQGELAEQGGILSGVGSLVGSGANVYKGS